MLGNDGSRRDFIRRHGAENKIGKQSCNRRKRNNSNQQEQPTTLGFHDFLSWYLLCDNEPSVGINNTDITLIASQQKFYKYCSKIAVSEAVLERSARMRAMRGEKIAGVVAKR